MLYLIDKFIQYLYHLWNLFYFSRNITQTEDDKLYKRIRTIWTRYKEEITRMEMQFISEKLEWYSDDQILTEMMIVQKKFWLRE